MIPEYNYLGYSHENVEGLGQDLRYWPKFWLLRGQNLLTHLYIYINDVQTTSTKKNEEITKISTFQYVENERYYWIALKTSKIELFSSQGLTFAF